MEQNIKSRISKIQRLPRALTIEDWSKLIGVVDRERDKFILYLLVYTGMRVGEATSVKYSDIDWSSKKIRVLGKGSRERYVDLHPMIYEMLLKHKGKKGKIVPLTRERVEQIVKEYAKKAGLSSEARIGVTPHKLRHTFATWLLESDVDIRTVQELLGHKDLATTMIYTHVTDKRRKEAVNRLPSV